MTNKYVPTVLSIAGSDPYAGAGIQVDSKTIHALGAYAFSCISALSAQNSTGVKTLQPTDKVMFKEQLESILDDVYVDAIKIGMLANSDLVTVLIDIIDKYKLKNIVLDPVLLSSSGHILLEKDAIDIMVHGLFPRVDIITPNIPEVNTFLTYNDTREEDIERMGKSLLALNANAVLIKGGHSLNQDSAIDYLIQKPFKIKAYRANRINSTHTHGTGCVLSSAIATHLAQGYDLEKSVELSKIFLNQTLQSASTLNFNYLQKNKIRKEPLL
ncbi:MAG: bifunctional hydroxymethylpyrimidine kinase/phosphomethylpyrimidine kinase [Epsilonproteobacteria bacterium]|nr:MAG: bifunctional hydroxymethylpyrimidine kinase/phosphomethylpyrimidine kinase [Campylobacterota bacterium]